MLRLRFLAVLSFSLILSANSCHFNVKLKQSLQNEGFHRNLTYGISFNTDEESESRLYKDCIIALDQTLPTGVYAYPDELGDLRRAGKINAIPKNRVNIELPTEQCSASSVFITGQVVVSQARVWLPVHARYHQAAAGGGTARNIIDPPKLYLRCPDQRLDTCKKLSPEITFLCNASSKEKCSWKEIPYTLISDTVIWDVPVGNTDHYNIVASVTGLVIGLQGLYLLKTIHDYKMAASKKKK